MTEEQGQQCCNINMSAGKRSIPPPLFMKGAQEQRKHIAAFKRSWFHIRREKCKSQRTHGKGQNAGGDDGTELPVFCLENEPSNTGEPKDITQNIRQNPDGPNGKDINGQFGLDASCDLVAGWNVDHLDTAGQKNQN